MRDESLRLATHRRRVRILDGHCSGHYSATFDQWQALCEAFAEAGNARFSLTECGSPVARRALHSWAKTNGWDIVQFPGAGAGECAILSDRDALKLLQTSSDQLTDLVLKTARKAPIHATSGQYEHLSSGIMDWRSAAHLPAHLEGRRGFRRGWPAKVHRDAVKGWKVAMVGRVPRTLMFDGNLNARLAWVRAWAAHKFPRLNSAWSRRLPAWGTFKRRIIDLCVTSLRHGRPRRLPVVPGFDHRGFTIWLTLTHRRSTRT